MTIETVLIILLLLTVKHFLADFVFQYPFMYLNKGTYLHMGGIVHALAHAVPTYTIVVFYAGIKAAVIVATVEFLIHYHVDWAKVKINTKYKLAPNTSEKYWWLLGADQLLHSLTYIWIVWYLV